MSSYSLPSVMQSLFCDPPSRLFALIKVDDVNNSDGKASLKRQTQSVPKLPLNNIFQSGLAAINTTYTCVCKYFARLRHNASGDRNPNKSKYKINDQRDI